MIPVTDEMVQAARRKLPARWSMQDLHDAISAALEAAPHGELQFDQGVALTPEQRAAWNEAYADLAEPNKASGHLIRVFTPQLHPVLDHPLVLGGISEIASRLEVARSTVAGWVKRAEKIGMPDPITVLAAGPVYDLTVLEAWYRGWKDGPDADSQAH